MTLGAYNCFRFEHGKMPVSPDACMKRTHFLEDIECLEMHAYADQVQAAIRVGTVLAAGCGAVGVLCGWCLLVFAACWHGLVMAGLCLLFSGQDIEWHHQRAASERETAWRSAAFAEGVEHADTVGRGQRVPARSASGPPPLPTCFPAPAEG